jgi:hypothetical protein
MGTGVSSVGAAAAVTSATGLGAMRARNLLADESTPAYFTVW